MIPKILHFIWLSDNPELPQSVTACIDSWKKQMPNYEIIKWNEKNFDIKSSPIYVQEAYAEKKYAFVSDYVRLWVLYNNGGIYMDTDVATYRSFDDLLENKAFTGFEDKDKIGAWLLASEPGNSLFKQFMDDYKGRKFILSDGKYDTLPNPFPITKRLLEHGLIKNGKLQRLDEITVYPIDYFCPFNPYREGDDCFTKNTYCSHHFEGEWLKHKTDKEKHYLEIDEKYIKILGKWLGPKVHKHISIIRHSGFIDWAEKYLINRRK